VNEEAPIQYVQAQAGPPPDGGAGGILASPLLFLGAMLLLMWALVIRPQQRQQKEHRQMLGQIAKGDRIVTSGGIHGVVVGVTDDVLTVEIAEKVRVKLNKSAVATRIAKGEGDKS
jgi:preprotein translocase subunit YajC